MGILLELYRSTDGPQTIAALEALGRAWSTGDGVLYYKLREQFGVDDLGLPRGTAELEFESKRTGAYPTTTKLGSLLRFMAARDLPRLWEVFGFSSCEPEPPAHYRIPDWRAALVGIRACRAALATARASSLPLRDADTITPGSSKFDKHAHLQHQIDTQREDVEHHRRMIEALEEMIEWVLEQPDPHNFLVCWSW